MRKIRRTKREPVVAAKAPEESGGIKFQLSGKAWWAIALIGIMVFSAVGFYYADRQDLAPGYNGFRFKLGPNSEYLLKWQQEFIPFTSHPTELQAIPIDPQAMALLRTAPQILLTFDANSTEPAAVELVRFRIAQRLAEQRGVAVGIGTLQPSVLYAMPVITCANATQYVPVLEMTIGEPEGLQLQDGCMLLRAPAAASLQALGERVEYGLLGVIL